MVLQYLSPRIPWYSCGLAASERSYLRIVSLPPSVCVQLYSYYGFLQFGEIDELARNKTTHREL